MGNQDENNWRGKNVLWVFQPVETQEKDQPKIENSKGKEGQIRRKYLAKSVESVLTVNETSDSGLKPVNGIIFIYCCNFYFVIKANPWLFPLFEMFLDKRLPTHNIDPFRVERG